MSNIKINDVYQRIQYVAVLNQTVFAIPFPFFQNNYVFVWVNGIELNQGLAAGQYTVTGAGSPSGGTITMVTPLINGDIVTIEGKMPIDRTSIYSATISNLTGSDLNGDFNREVVMMKQIETVQDLLQLQYAPWAVISQDPTVTKDRYIPLLPPLCAWRMNAGGTAIETFLTPSSGGLAPEDATYLIQIADSDLPNAQAMGALASGFVINTTTTGVQLTRILEGVTNQTAITNANGIAANPTIGLAANALLPGSEGMGLPGGTTAQRPGSPFNGQTRFNSDLLAIEYYTGSGWDQLSGGVVDTVSGFANQIEVDNTDPINPIIKLPSVLNVPGTFNIQSTTAINAIINDSTLATATTSNIATAAALKTYIDNLVTGLNIQGSCVCASTTALTVTYANGTAGVGATLTNAGAFAAISLDGVSPTVGQRVLIKNQASSLQNGIYTVTTVGDGVSVNWVLTRATDYDTPSEVQPGDLVVLTGGTTQTQSSWLETATVAAVGTDPITFVQFTASLPVNVASGGTGVTSFTAYRILAGGLTSTGSLQQIGIGSLGQLLQSQGAGALAAYTTTTYPATNAINTIMYASSANVLGSIAAANSSVMVSSAGGVPSFSTTLPAGLTIPGYQASITPAALTKTDDTNVTLTLGGTPTTALLQATSLTLGWTGLLSVPRGGTGLGTTTAYAVLCGGTTSTGALQSIASVGTSGQVLTSNGAGALPTMKTPAAAAGGVKSFQIFTSGTAATYTRPAGVTSILVELWGGGGGGGGVTATASSVSSAGGGGAGGYARLYVASASATYTYTVGAGGNGGAAGTNDGSTGGTTSFSASSLQATGGIGGKGTAGALTTSAIAVLGGLGGVGTNGDVNANGSTGGVGIMMLGVAASGLGANSPIGGGGQSVITIAAGNNATVYASGGSGAVTGSATNRAGGNGSAGLIIVWEFS